MVKHISDRLAVMSRGKIVEMASTVTLFDNPIHPYTEALLAAVPIPDTELKRERIIIGGKTGTRAKGRRKPRGGVPPSVIRERRNHGK